MPRYVWVVRNTIQFGIQFGNLRWVADDYMLQADEREGWSDEEVLPRLEDLPGFIPRLPLQEQVISRRQFFQAAAARGMITRDEALAAMQHGTIPPLMQQGLDTLSPDEKFAAEMMLSGANEFNRYHPMVQKFGEVMGMPPNVLDDIWRFAATL